MIFLRDEMMISILKDLSTKYRQIIKYFVFLFQYLIILDEYFVYYKTEKPREDDQKMN